MDFYVLGVILNVRDQGPNIAERLHEADMDVGHRVSLLGVVWLGEICTFISGEVH